MRHNQRHYSSRQREKLKFQQKLEAISSAAESVTESVAESIDFFNSFDLKGFVRKIHGQVVTSAHEGYEQDKIIFNKAYQANPLMIVYCICIKDVKACLELARKTKIPFRVRSSGHSFAGYSMEEGCLLIDVSKLNHVGIDPRAMTLQVGTGATLDAIDVALNDFGLHLPSGSCGDVRISGYMMGGGYGFTSRMFGMNCDNVLEVLVMLADGSLVIANTGQNQDLFWAIRGGTGGNFGVLLQIKYRVVKLEKVWGFLLKYPMEKAAQVLAETQKNYTTTCHPKLSVQSAGYLNFLPSMNYYFVAGLYLGTEEEGLKTISSLLEIDKDCLVSTMYDRYLNVNQHIWDDMMKGSEAAAASSDDSVPFVNTTGYMDQVLTVAQWQEIMDVFVNTSPHVPRAICMEAYGGAINHTTSGINVFGHREVNMNLYFTGMWMDAEGKPEVGEKMKKGAISLIENLNNMLIERNYFTGKSYQNYPSRYIDQWSTAYWGDAYQKLANVKMKYDPDGLFDFPQGISLKDAELGIVGTPIVREDFD